MSQTNPPAGAPRHNDPVEAVTAVIDLAANLDDVAGDRRRPDVVPVAVPAVATPTQLRHPWRSILRTWIAALIGFAAMAPLIYQAAVDRNPELASGWAASALAICGGVTRVLALPGVERILRATPVLRWFSAAPAPPAT